MHGRPRAKPGASADPERVKAAEKKAALFGQLAGEVLSRRAAGRYDADSLALAASLLELHPEVYTVWNYRREALDPVLVAGGEAAVAAVGAELALTERALARNPKSYSTWHHRRWLVAKGFCSLEHELQLVGKLLDADPRNFHGWGYRRFVVQLMGTPAGRELDYAQHKINQNFSNYSAWHSRTTLLPVAHGSRGDAGDAAAAQALSAALRQGASLDDGLQPRLGSEGQEQQQQERQADDQQQQQKQQERRERLAEAPTARHAGAGSAAATSAVPKEALDHEYELVKQAFYTEPEDQSGWFYHRWLLGCSLAHWEEARGSEAEAAERQALLAVLRREQQTCEELLEIEPNAKWPLLTLTRLKELQLQVLTSSCGSEAAAAERPSSDGSLAAEVAGGYARLKALDPLRRGYYEDAEQGRAHVVARPTVAA